jgi:hypothetical protein
MQRYKKDLKFIRIDNLYFIYFIFVLYYLLKKRNETKNKKKEQKFFTISNAIL